MGSVEITISSNWRGSQTLVQGHHRVGVADQGLTQALRLHPGDRIVDPLLGRLAPGAPAAGGRHQEGEAALPRSARRFSAASSSSDAAVTLASTSTLNFQAIGPPLLVAIVTRIPRAPGSERLRPRSLGGLEPSALRSGSSP